MRDENDIRLLGIQLAIAFPADPHILDRFSANRHVARELENLLLHDQIVLLSKGWADPEPKRQHGCCLKTLHRACLLSIQRPALPWSGPPMHLTMRQSVLSALAPAPLADGGLVGYR